MPAMNRTSEFRAACERARLSARRQTSGPTPAKLKGTQRTEFSRQAAAIAKDIQSTAAKLEKLAQLAKRKTLFDDRPVEISELTYIIKRDIAGLNSQIASLQTLVQSQGASGTSSSKEHSSNVVVMLQNRLASTSMGFKDVLEIRTQNMKASKTRTEQFGHAGQPLGAMPNGPPSDSPLYAQNSAPYDPKGKGKVTEQDFLALDMGASPAVPMQQTADGYMQMQLQDQEGAYLNQRSSAIESIESTIAELGQIFGQLAQMVAQQGETVQRIDADVSDISTNVTGAQRELLKYYASVSSNRWLMLKIFGTLILCARFAGVCSLQFEDLTSVQRAAGAIGYFAGLAREHEASCELVL